MNSKELSLTKTCFFIVVISALFSNCKEQENVDANQLEKTEVDLKIITQRQDSIIDTYLVNGANKYGLYDMERQIELDKGLAVDSTIAYLWQQKAMPLFKQGKYEKGMEYIDQAVIYDRQRWQDYRAFIKCIFAKTYRAAIVDFEDYQKRYGDGYVMDHTYNFHIALSYLQLNEFEKAEAIFEKDHEKQLAEHGEKWMHPVDLFYYGISKYEQAKYEEAIQLFDLALGLQDQFSDVQYYKSNCLWKIGKKEEARALYKIAEANGKQGYSFNEDNAIYERYPYQVRWH